MAFSAQRASCLRRADAIMGVSAQGEQAPLLTPDVEHVFLGTTGVVVPH